MPQKLEQMVLLNQQWTFNLILTTAFALLASFSLGFNLISFEMLNTLVRHFVKNETVVTYIQESRHFRIIRLVDDFRIDADYLYLYQKGLNLTTFCDIKDELFKKNNLDSHMSELLNYVCKVGARIEDIFNKYRSYIYLLYNN